MIHLDKPSYCYESGCPLAACRCTHLLSQHNLSSGVCEAIIITKKKEGKGKSAVVTEISTPCPCKEFHSKGTGFVLGAGDPLTAQFAIQAEGPGPDEVSYRMGSDKSRNAFDKNELERRLRDYPELRDQYKRFIDQGSPLVGKTGKATESWTLKPYGLDYQHIFVDNTLRCLPPKNKQGAHYPIGAEREQAETCCEHWNRMNLMKPDIAIVAIHQASLLREITPLPLNNQAAFQRAVDFMKLGYKVVVAFGGKAAKAVLGYAENSTRWVGEYKWMKNK